MSSFLQPSISFRRHLGLIKKHTLTRSQFRSYIDPLNANTSSMHPPSIPPPPPPPPPLNIPPSRARMQLAARLAKRNAAAAAASGGEQEGTSPPSTSDATPAFGTFSNLAANAPGSNGERSRNPFADDDDGSGSGSDDGEIGRGNSDDDDEDTGGSAWNRGSWWRNVVKTTKRANKNKGPATEGAGKDGNGVGVERFGDGRDDSDEEGDEEDEDDEIEDEEFGDFAMPEVEGGASGSGGATGGLVSGIDPAREKILLKPLPVHPNSLKTGSSPFGSLWPFSSSGSAYGSKTGEEKGEEEKDKGAEITEEPIRLDLSSGSESTVIVGEDGKKINRAVEAKRRTSIEDPDDDEPVDIGVVEESIVGRAELG
ncbi:hypothetical protein B0T22DRAFT_375943 [Podospora appendiculata]|uniref:Uncharacterized protein n=1 Tax=Podospora appendiculata TaxID=314037 RepID=A0AAE0XAD6_9PEZI|nr:hypothetical protein B0T22DRAFT_375943 [Podospora appendiculata]